MPNRATKKPAPRISDAGRERMRESGRRNAAAALEARIRALPAIRAASRAFEDGLTAQLGGDADLTPQQRALVTSATASYTGLCQVLDRLRSARRYRRIAELLAEVTPLQGGLLRCLRALNLTPKDGGEPAPSDVNAELAAIEAEIHGARHDSNS